MDSFMPHGYCLSWNPQLIWLFVIGNSLVTLSYYSIPAALAVIVAKKRHLAFNWMFVLFAAFIFACGTTHLIKIWTLWHPNYWIEGVIDAFTGVLSATTAILLWPLIPKILALPSAAELEAVNRTLNESEQKTRSILDKAYSAFVAIDANGTITDWNHQAEVIFGWSRQEVIGQPMANTIIPLQYRQAHIQSLKRFHTTGKGTILNKRIEITGLHRDGSEFPIELAVFPVQLGSDYSFCAFIADITERKKTETVRKRLQDELARSNAELQRFAYVAAHDLREPLRTLISYTNLLADECAGKISKNAEENMGFILDAGRRMQQLISDLLAYSRIETQAKAFVETNCNVILDETVTSLKTTIEESKAQVTHDKLPTINADPVQLSQLFLNLLGNALKFKGQNLPKIHISAKQQNNEWLFSVADNGIGIDMKFSDRIFQMFQRLHGMTEYEGTGIGLAICKRIVERHGGKIWFESTPGQGTVFFFTIPS